MFLNTVILTVTRFGSLKMASYITTETNIDYLIIIILIIIFFQLSNVFFLT